MRARRLQLTAFVLAIVAAGAAFVVASISIPAVAWSIISAIIALLGAGLGFYVGERERRAARGGDRQ